MPLPFPAAIKYANRKHYYHVLASRVADRQTFIVTSIPPEPPDDYEKETTWESNESTKANRGHEERPQVKGGKLPPLGASAGGEISTRRKNAGARREFGLKGLRG